jgi:thymidylate kinase
MSTDLYQSFKLYQSQILFEYEHMMDEYNFRVVAADESIENVQKVLRSAVRDLLGDDSLQISSMTAG